VQKVFVETQLQEHSSMSTRFFRTILILFLIPASLACSLFTATPAPNPADIEKEELAVYAVFAGRSKRPAVILQNTSIGLSDEESSRQSMENFKDSLPGISRETIESYAERNEQTTQLSADMQLGVDYVLLSEEELKEISSQGNWHEILQEQYPDSNGYLIFSRVGFNRTLDQAVIYVGEVAGPLMGAGYYYLLEKQNGEWMIKEETMVWIS
jgi:hypothetical protein